MSTSEKILILHYALYSLIRSPDCLHAQAITPRMMEGIVDTSTQAGAGKSYVNMSDAWTPNAAGSTQGSCPQLTCCCMLLIMARLRPESRAVSCSALLSELIWRSVISMLVSVTCHERDPCQSVKPWLLDASCVLERPRP